jgi:hypothetical protein
MLSGRKWRSADLQAASFSFAGLWRCWGRVHGRLMLACSGGRALILIEPGAGDNPSNEVRGPQAIEGPDRDRSGHDSEREKRQNEPVQVRC